MMVLPKRRFQLTQILTTVLRKENIKITLSQIIR